MVWPASARAGSAIWLTRVKPVVWTDVSKAGAVSGTTAPPTGNNGHFIRGASAARPDDGESAVSCAIMPQ